MKRSDLFLLLCILSVILFKDIQAQDIRWAPKLIFNHDQSNIAIFDESEAHTGIIEGNQANTDTAGMNSLLTIAEYTEPVTFKHLYIVAQELEPSVKGIFIISSTGHVSRIDRQIITIVGENDHYILGFTEEQSRKPYEDVHKIMVSMVSTQRNRSPNIIAIGSSDESDRLESFSNIHFETVLTSVKEIKVIKRNDSNTRQISYHSQKQKLDRSVNSAFEEVKPVISPDGNYLYFARKGYPNNVKGKKDQDIYVSQYFNGQWKRAESIGAPLNDKFPNGICSISPDGNTLLLANSYNSRGRAYDGISISRKTAEGWSQPEGLTIEGYVNICHFHDFCLSNDGDVLIIAVENELTYGDQDIYVSFRLDDRTFTKPENVGPVINTDGVEYSPFLAADGITLYFSSNGHRGYGAGDAFMSKRLDDSWTNWSQPINMGEEINTRDWDGYFTITAKGDYAYFTSSGSRTNERIFGTEDEDIYRIALREEVKPEPMIVLKGNVFNNKTKEPMSAELILQHLAEKKDDNIQNTSAENNYYSFVLPIGKVHQLSAHADGFLPESFNFDNTTVTQYTEIEQDIFLNPIERGEILKLHNLFFVQSRAELLPESMPELERLFQLMLEFPEMEIELMGHTDSQGVAAANLRLSKERAQAVKDFLVDRGIERSRIEAVGYGEKKPIVSNKDPELRKQNRRVEVKIIRKQ